MSLAQNDDALTQARRMTLEQPAYTSSSDLGPEIVTRFFRTEVELEPTFERQADGSVDKPVIDHGGAIRVARRVAPQVGAAAQPDARSH